MGAGSAQGFSPTRCVRVQHLHSPSLSLVLTCATRGQAALHRERFASLGAYLACLVSHTDVLSTFATGPVQHPPLSRPPGHSACMTFGRHGTQPQIAVESFNEVCQPHGRPERLPDRVGCDSRPRVAAPHQSAWIPSPFAHATPLLAKGCYPLGPNTLERRTPQ